MPRALTLRSFVLALLVIGCTSIESDLVDEPPALLSSIQVYTTGEDVTMALQLLNTTGEPIELTFPTGQSYDFVVLEAEREVWRWSADRMFTQAVRRERLEAGEALRFEETWRPEDIGSGEYIVEGELASSDHRLRQSTRFVLP